MRDDMARVIVERPRIPAFKVRKGRDSTSTESQGNRVKERSVGMIGAILPRLRG